MRCRDYTLPVSRYSLFLLKLLSPPLAFYKSQLAPFDFWFSLEMDKRNLGKIWLSLYHVVFFKLSFGLKGWIVAIFFLKNQNSRSHNILGQVFFSHTFKILSSGVWFYSVSSTADGIPASLRPEALSVICSLGKIYNISNSMPMIPTCSQEILSPVLRGR